MSRHGERPPIGVDAAPDDAVLGTIDLLPIRTGDAVTDHVVVRAVGQGATLLFGEVASARGRHVSEATPPAPAVLHQLLGDTAPGEQRSFDLRQVDRMMRVLVTNGADGLITIVFARFDDRPRRTEPADPATLVDRLRTMMAAQGDNVALYEPVRDADGTIVDFLCLEVVGADLALPVEEQLGKRMLEMFPDLEASGFLGGYRSAMDGGEPWVPEPIVYVHHGQRYRYRVRAAEVDGLLVVAWRDTLIEDEPDERNATGERLTSRQLDILAAIADGRPTADIASTLFLSPFTVRNEVRRIFVKLGVRTRAEAVAAALSRGLLPPRTDRG